MSNFLIFASLPTENLTRYTIALKTNFNTAIKKTHLFCKKLYRLNPKIILAKIILGLRRYSFLQNKWVFLIAVLKLVFSAIVYLVKFSVGREAKIKKFDNRMTSEAIKDTEFIIRKTSPIINKHR